MATRYYLPSTGASDVNPAFDAGWAETADADRRQMVLTKISSADTAKSVTTLSVAETELVRQYVGPTLGPQTISGTVKCQVRALEGGIGSADAICRLMLKIVSNDGSTVRGNLLALEDYGSGLEWALGSATNRSFSLGPAIASVTTQNGDRAVLELGCFHAAVALTVTLNFSDDNGTDLPEDETETAAFNPWLEFSQTLLPQGEGTTQDLFVTGAVS